jgi:DNA-binding transcriptional regulator YiaG
MAISASFSTQIISPDIVRGLREKLGMAQAELAYEAKVSPAEVKAYEDGEATTFQLVDAIGSALQRHGAVFPKPS